MIARLVVGLALGGVAASAVGAVVATGVGSEGWEGIVAGALVTLVVWVPAIVGALAAPTTASAARRLGSIAIATVTLAWWTLPTDVPDADHSAPSPSPPPEPSVDTTPSADPAG